MLISDQGANSTCAVTHPSLTPDELGSPLANNFSAPSISETLGKNGCVPIGTSALGTNPPGPVANRAALITSVSSEMNTM